MEKQYRHHILIDFEDDDLGSCIKGLEKVKSMYPNEEIIFANGGDRTKKNSPEYDTYSKLPWVRFEFGVGGTDKINSSSSLLKNWEEHV